MTRLTTLLLTLALAGTALADDPNPPKADGMNSHPLPDSGTDYGYLSYLPPNYDAKSGKHPLVIFLHGKGELGDSKTTLNALTKHGPFKLIKKDPKIFAEANAVVLAPQGLKSDNWWRWEKLDDFLKHALKEYKVDKDRIYLTGLSMGGGGTWIMASRHPKTFAAIVPICGAARPGKDIEIGKAPVWAFHSQDDKVVSVYHTEDWLNTLADTEKKGRLLSEHPQAGTQSASFDGRKWIWTEGQHAPTGQLGVTVYPDASHDSWTRAYKDPKFWEWLFAQKR